jgi:hypothetical protein
VPLGVDAAGFYSTAPLEKTCSTRRLRLINNAGRGSPSAPRMSAPAR